MPSAAVEAALAKAKARAEKALQGLAEGAADSRSAPSTVVSAT